MQLYFRHKENEFGLVVDDTKRLKDVCGVIAREFAHLTGSVLDKEQLRVEKLKINPITSEPLVGQVVRVPVSRKIRDVCMPYDTLVLVSNETDVSIGDTLRSKMGSTIDLERVESRDEAAHQNKCVGSPSFNDGVDTSNLRQRKDSKRPCKEQCEEEEEVLRECHEKNCIDKRETSKKTSLEQVDKMSRQELVAFISKTGGSSAKKMGKKNKAKLQWLAKNILTTHMPLRMRKAKYMRLDQLKSAVEKLEGTAAKARRSKAVLIARFSELTRSKKPSAIPLHPGEHDMFAESKLSKGNVDTKGDDSSLEDVGGGYASKKVLKTTVQSDDIVNDDVVVETNAENENSVDQKEMDTSERFEESSEESSEEDREESGEKRKSTDVTATDVDGRRINNANGVLCERTKSVSGNEDDSSSDEDSGEESDDVGDLLGLCGPPTKSPSFYVLKKGPSSISALRKSAHRPKRSGFISFGQFSKGLILDK